jgi:hypothetical protein
MIITFFAAAVTVGMVVRALFSPRGEERCPTRFAERS